MTPVLEAVHAQAQPHGWVDVARHASPDQGLIEVARGRPDEAVPWLVRCVAVGLDAHQRLAAILQGRGDRVWARRHRMHNARALADGPGAPAR